MNLLIAMMADTYSAVRCDYSLISTVFRRFFDDLSTVFRRLFDDFSTVLVLLSYWGSINALAEYQMQFAKIVKECYETTVIFVIKNMDFAFPMMTFCIKNDKLEGASRTAQCYRASDQLVGPSGRA